MFFAIKSVSTKKLNFNFFNIRQNIPIKNYVLSVIFVIICVFSNYISWQGFKIFIEYKNAGLLGFIAQHVYYFAEIAIVATIIVLFQKACEVWFKHTHIPYGGIVAAVTWGLAHIFTQDSIIVGLLAFLYSFCFGSVYLLLKRNFKLTILFLYLMFVI